jgi:hypothetical protein
VGRGERFRYYHQFCPFMPSATLDVEYIPLSWHSTMRSLINGITLCTMDFDELGASGLKVGIKTYIVLELLPIIGMSSIHLQYRSPISILPFRSTLYFPTRQCRCASDRIPSFSSLLLCMIRVVMNKGAEQVQVASTLKIKIT